MRYLLLLGLSCWALLASAQINPPLENHIDFQLQAEQWAVTDTAKVVMTVNAVVNEAQLAQLQTHILQKLNQLAKGDWHITQFNRSSNQAGLEQLFIEAQIRLPESDLGHLRSQAQKISRAGETYTLQNILFEPTLAETETAREQIREKIYQSVQQEIVRLNKIYPNQHYQVHRIDFNEQSFMPQPMAMRVAENSAPSLSVNNKITMHANVDLVS